MNDQHGRDPVGSAAEEAARLFVALADRARDHLTGAGDLGGAGHAAECRWCPLCQAIAFVRDTSPEARQQVVSSATSLALALRDLAESAARPPYADRDGAGEHRTSHPDAQRIDIDGRGGADGEGAGWD